MNLIFSTLNQDNAIKDLYTAYKASTAQTYIYGAGGSQKHLLFAQCWQYQPHTTLIITNNQENLETWKEDLRALLPEAQICELPTTDSMRIAATTKGLELTAQRLQILSKLTQGKQLIVLATAQAVIQKEIHAQKLDQLALSLHINKEYDFSKVLQSLVELGYEHTDKVSGLGEFSARGGIIDVFPINLQQPIRIEFFDNEIESIREFSIDTQRSLEVKDKVSILPLLASEATSNNEAETSVLSYLPENSKIVIDEPLRLKEQIRDIVKENPEFKENIVDYNHIIKASLPYNVIYLSLLLQRIPEANVQNIISIATKSVAPFRRQFHLLCEELHNYIDQEYKILVLVSDDNKIKYLENIFAENKLPFTHNVKTLKPGVVTLAKGSLLDGFEYPQARLVVISEKDILGRQKKKLSLRQAPKTSGQKLTHFRDIKIGDYVVHANHGIGKYLGIKTLLIGDIHRDYLEIQYSGTDKLFVPTDQVHLIQKYIGNESSAPKLSKMNGTAWKKAKSKVKTSVENIAKELIALYAERKKTPGFAFAPDTPWQHEFEDAFMYEETPDQLRAIKEIKEDMESNTPMDRLLCGDVGFGKTEVAIRAAFKAVMNNKQVAVLVPTTVLLQQHYQTFTNRLHDFGPKVGILCRFNSALEQKKILADLEAGQLDIIIGTHALLNDKKVKFKDLGLLIVDEEQRFGVKQKEKIKQLTKNVDILSLSATPIPRSLHMSLVGARDMSIIETPPQERFPAQTYVVENNDTIIRDALKRELRRGGQAYFIYNRVDNMEKMYLHLSSMLPDARIVIAHGQMNEEALESAMLKFYEGNADILLASSIVENGLDVPNANTIIIYDADYFGLSQLYQMRGRVGRSKKMSFAYFIYQKDKILSEIAEKRLQAIKEFAQLGSGFKIAMRDLEIRGAGDILGAQQHGHIASVGFEMYCRLLEEAMHNLSSNEPLKEVYETTMDIKVDAYIDNYIEDPMNKIEVYQRIAAIRDMNHARQLGEELVDRFGPLTLPVHKLIEVAICKSIAHSLGIKAINQRPAFLEFSFIENPSFDVTNLANVQNYFKYRCKFLRSNNAMQIKFHPTIVENVLVLIAKILTLLQGGIIGSKFIPIWEDEVFSKIPTSVKNPHNSVK